MNFIKDTLNRYYLDIKNNIRFFLKIKKYGNELLFIKKDYKLIFEDNFKSDVTDNWIYGESWWNQPYHPGDLKQWFDKNMVKTTEDGLVLSTIKKPRYFKEIDTIIPTAIGNVQSKNGFYHGLYVFEAKLPKGKFLWPSIWLSGIKTWPPEIDILECWSQSDSNYKKHKNFTTNLHFTNNKGIKDHYGSYRHPMSLNSMENFIEYALLWDENKIEIFYNGYKVFKSSNKNIMNNLNSQEMRIILNNGISSYESTETKTDFIIKNVKFFKKTKS